MQTSSHCYCCKWHRKECRKNAFIYVGIYVCVSYPPASFAKLICYHQKRPLHFNLFSSFLSIFIFHFYVFICRIATTNTHVLSRHTHTHKYFLYTPACILLRFLHLFRLLQSRVHPYCRSSKRLHSDQSPLILKV